MTTTVRAHYLNPFHAESNISVSNNAPCSNKAQKKWGKNKICKFCRLFSSPPRTVNVIAVQYHYCDRVILYNYAHFHRVVAYSVSNV